MYGVSALFDVWWTMELNRARATVHASVRSKVPQNTSEVRSTDMINDAWKMIPASRRPNIYARQRWKCLATRASPFEKDALYKQDKRDGVTKTI